MFNVPCPFCAEPYDNDELHEIEGLSYPEAQRLFMRFGCGLFDDWDRDASPVRCNRHGDDNAAEHARMLYTLLGSDFDGVAAEWQDLGF